MNKTVTFTYEEALAKSVGYFKGDELAATTFLNKYALCDREDRLVEATPEDMHWRMANEFARIENTKFKKPLSAREIFECFDHFGKIVPQGSLMAGIGNKYQIVSLSNCYVIPPPLDSYGGILMTDEQLVQISKRRGGVGTDLSNLRPDGTATTNAAKSSTGIQSFQGRYSNSVREVGQNGRRGALMLSLDVHHPEVLKFAKSKHDKKKRTGANISLRLSDEFMNSVEKGKNVELRWPVDSKNPKISREVDAKSVWRQIIEEAHWGAEPGLLFWDNIIRESPSDCYASVGYPTVGTNPCAELPLPAYDSCRLLVLNLFAYVKNPFTKEAYFDFDEFYTYSQIAQRLMDDVIDLELECIQKIIDKITNDPEPEEVKERELLLWKKIQKTCAATRRTGTGITALGDALAAINLGYDTDEGIATTERIYRTLKLGCYRSSVDMAKELGAFSIWDAKLEKNNPFLLRIKKEDPKLYSDMQEYGRRNIGLLTTAPTGSVSIETQTTSGIEPLYKISYNRKKKVNPNDKNVRIDFVDDTGDSWQNFPVYHHKVALWMEITGETDTTKSPWYGHCAHDIDWKKRIEIQAAATKHIDHSISSTINLPADTTVETIAEIYETAWKAGLKGITVYRDGCRDGVLTGESDKCGSNNNAITKTNAPKRPKTLPCDVHHVSVKGTEYLVFVGLLGNEPYEVFAMKNGQMPKSVKKGELVKIKRGHYKAVCENDYTIENVMEESGDLEEAITRLVSSNLRHGADISFVVYQLEKTKSADKFGSFEKAIARSLKKYIPDGTKISGKACEKCGSDELERKEGCQICMSCGDSRCGS